MQQQSPELIELLLMLAITGGACFFFLAVRAVICYAIYSCYLRVPASHQRSSPLMIWLLMIPCFNIVWNFFVFPTVSRSIRDYRASLGLADGNDCGETLGWAFSVVYLLSAVFGLFGIIPLIGLLVSPLSCLAWIGYVVILVIYLLRIHETSGNLEPGL